MLKQYANLSRWANILLTSFVMCAVIVPHASAHLMVAQHGSLNFKDDGIFMVLSLPVSAFENSDQGFDVDKDGMMSAEEFAKHKSLIFSAVKNKITLSDKTGLRPLQGLLITPVISHDIGKSHSEQLVIMGRFALDKTKMENSKGLIFHIGLFGKKPDEKEFTITASSKPITNVETKRHKIVLTQKHSENQLFIQ